MEATVYLAQLFGWLAAIGAIFADGQTNKLRLFLAAITTASIGTAAVTSYNQEKEAAQLRRYTETILTSVETPYFIIDDLSQKITAIAEREGFTEIAQSNLKRGTIYSFHASDQLNGKLFVSESEFKELWLLDSESRSRTIESRMIDDANDHALVESSMSGMGMTKSERHLLDFLRASLAVNVPDSHAVGLQVDLKNGKWTLTVKFRQEPDVELWILRSTREDLMKMTPLKRYLAAEATMLGDIERIRANQSIVQP